MRTGNFAAGLERAMHAAWLLRAEPVGSYRHIPSFAVASRFRFVEHMPPRGPPASATPVQFPCGTENKVGRVRLITARGFAGQPMKCGSPSHRVRATATCRAPTVLLRSAAAPSPLTLKHESRMGFIRRASGRPRAVRPPSLHGRAGRGPYAEWPRRWHRRSGPSGTARHC